MRIGKLPAGKALRVIKSSPKWFGSTIPGAAHFKWRELAFSATAFREGIDNTPTIDALIRLANIAARIAEPARLACGRIVISSGYRCLALNRLVGGAPNSAHRYGAALDMQPLDCSPAELALWLSENASEYDQIIYESRTLGLGKKTWVHAALWPGNERPNRVQLLRHINGDSGYQPIDIGYLKSLI